KAKEARPIAERMITLGKRGGLANVRLAARTVRSKAVLSKVFGELAKRFAERPGGYTRTPRTRYRRGDPPQRAILERLARAAGGGGGWGGGGEGGAEGRREGVGAPKRRARGYFRCSPFRISQTFPSSVRSCTWVIDMLSDAAVSWSPLSCLRLKVRVPPLGST